MRAAVIHSLLAALLVAAAGACTGDDIETTETDASAAAATTVAVEVTVAENGTSQDTVPAPATTAGGLAVADCGPAALLAAMQDEFGSGATDYEVSVCQNGYAQVFLLGGPEIEQVFLGWDRGAWGVLQYGTGISCDDEGWLAEAGNDEARTFCTALGFPPS